MGGLAWCCDYWATRDGTLVRRIKVTGCDNSPHENPDSSSLPSWSRQVLDRRSTEGLATGHGGVWGVIRRDDNLLIGVISLQGRADDNPVLGYWIGVDYWSKGYATGGPAA
ncbi:GNAT family N-acetyltransferase [Pseudomonas putida]|uniref:N-acetyltransferase domain-containing protein n=1 Tax=Pseudomonas putida TaxID=303 RepID=A0A1X0ZQM4_PSEPU|nr:GNAT family N-acetyltransferase [Pseudomonas putida]MEB3901292.1 GNAT family N-acetyltransferase [Pseudomonas putida]ORL61165.1 hypothetical protein B7H17_21525 [Pseudomonas putida]